MALVQLTHWILCYKKDLGFLASASVLCSCRSGRVTELRCRGTAPPLALKHRTDVTETRSLTGLCTSAVSLQPRSLSTHRVKSNSLANNTRHLHSQLNPCCFSGISLRALYEPPAKEAF